LKPMLNKLNPPPPEPLALENESAEALEKMQLEEDGKPMGIQNTYQQNLEAAKELARKDPKVVANIVKSWVGND